MKIINILLLVLIFAGLDLSAQDSPYKSYKIDNGQLIYQQVYECDTMKADAISTMLSSEVPKIKGLKGYYKDGTVITAEFKNAMIDYRMMGGKWGSTPILLNSPFDANVTIEWKDYKYRVTISNIVFHSAFGETDLGSLLTKRKYSMWDNSNGARQVGDFTERYYTTLFWISPTKDNW